MDRLCSQEAPQTPLPHIFVILDTDLLETAPGPAKRMESGVTLYRPVNLVCNWNTDDYCMYMTSKHQNFSQIE